jgi:hypothetical protein
MVLDVAGSNQRIDQFQPATGKIEIGPRPTHAALLDRVRELVTVLSTGSPEANCGLSNPGVCVRQTGRRNERRERRRICSDGTAVERGVSVSSARMSFELGARLQPPGTVRTV